MEFRITLRGVLVAAILGSICHSASAQSGSATLNWVKAVTNVDGSTLTNLVGTKIYWGPSASSFPNSTTLNNPATTSYVVTPLGAGTWYFTVASLNTAGVESSRSNVASKTIQGTPTTPVTIGGPVFSIQTTDNAMVNPQLGTVVAGRLCDATTGATFGGKTYLKVAVSDAVLFAGVDKAGLLLVTACL